MFGVHFNRVVVTIVVLENLDCCVVGWVIQVGVAIGDLGSVLWKVGIGIGIDWFS